MALLEQIAEAQGRQIPSRPKARCADRGDSSRRSTDSANDHLPEPASTADDHDSAADSKPAAAKIVVPSTKNPEMLLEYSDWTTFWCRTRRSPASVMYRPLGMEGTDTEQRTEAGRIPDHP